MATISKETREAIQIFSAVGMLVAGVSFGVAGFCVDPLGEISDSVLYISAQCFIYAGTAMGIAGYVQYKLNDFKKDIKNKME